MPTLLAVLTVLVSVVLAPAADAATPCILNSTCADGNLCNGIESCVADECQLGSPLECDDGDPCTRDFCDPAAGCAHAEDQCPMSCAALLDGARCADGTVCTRGDACAGGVCVPGPSVNCDDGDACTRDRCDAVLGCIYTEEAVVFPCVPDCNGGVADYTPCPGDNNICTLDACLPSVDLIGNPHMCIVGLRGLERPCQDNDVCNGQEFCSPVLGCQPGPPPVCDDGKSCNGVETCDPVLGCQPGTPEPDGTACDDGRECTTGDVCAAGVCGGVALPPLACDDADPLTTDVCENGFGCLHCVASQLGRLTLHTGRPGADTLKVRGELPAGSVGMIAPAVETVAVFVEDGATTLFRADLPPGTLVAGRSGSFQYRDRRGAIAGVRLLRLNARGGTFTWSLSAGGLMLPGTVPPSVTVRLVVGGDCFAAAVPCASRSASVICR
jgi:hypothetical protein